MLVLGRDAPIVDHLEMTQAVPLQLIADIDAGRCVAFVGAGFSAPAVQSWKALLLSLAKGLKSSEAVHGLIASGRSRDYEAAAQTIRDETGGDELGRRLRDLLADPHLDEIMRARVRYLTETPFRAVLTTNFDGILTGSVPGPEAFLRVLRQADDRWWSQHFWGGQGAGAPIVKLHGDAAGPDPVVFTQRDYRRRLYSNPAYTTFLRSVFSTQTMLYIGFSFTDAYLNELRSEVLSLLEHEGGDRPIAYALANDVTPEQAAYLRRHEGIEVLSFDTGGGADYSGFDAYLYAIHAETNPRTRLGRLIAGKTIVWVDPSDHSNEFGMEFLQGVAEDSGGSTRILRASDPESGLELIRRNPPDLVISYWGHGQGTAGPAATDLLAGMHVQNSRAPVLIFSGSDHADENKQAALRAGAAGLQCTWEGLFGEIERVFGGV